MVRLSTLRYMPTDSIRRDVTPPPLRVPPQPEPGRVPPAPAHLPDDRLLDDRLLDDRLLDDRLPDDLPPGAAGQIEQLRRLLRGGVLSRAEVDRKTAEILGRS